ncbi:class I SAM-dependent methyltransferase [Saccharicrinis sp. FJH54]|uniref:class I SAM-dependent methyltransferase n=1 Tax=Saccharicrinis sp. FJH54 TaxID=3344665 RepID=UPI0035D4BE7C
MKNYLKTDWDFNSEQLVELYDELPLWAAPFGLKLLDNIIYKKSINALDIGFGCGFPLTELAMRLDQKSLVYGIDPWERAIERTAKKIHFYNIKNVRLINGVAEQIPLKDNSIDLIISNNGLNNVENQGKALAECSRIIKAGGQFIQTMNLKDTMAEFYTVMENVLTDMNLTASVDLMHKHIYKKRKPLDIYLKQIESQGFIITNTIKDKFEYKFVDGTTLLNHYFIRLAFIDSWKEIVPPNKQEEVFDRIEKDLNSNSKNGNTIILSVPFVVIDALKQ